MKGSGGGSIDKSFDELCSEGEQENGTNVGGEAREFVFSLGETAACYYIDGTDPGRREILKMP